MKLVATIKIRIKHNRTLLEMSENFTHAVQYAIDKGFESKIANKFKLHHLVYEKIRKKFKLPADFAIEAIRKASENLKSTKLKKKSIIKKKIISFNRKLFTFSFDKVRLATFNRYQRIDIPLYAPEYYWKYLDWRYQTLELINNRGVLYFYITFSREARRHHRDVGKTVENAPLSCGNKIVGVDLGVNNLAVCSDGNVFKNHKTKIMQFQYLRRKLQVKGTKSAKRHLKKISGRQKRYMAWINHNISRKIVNSADTVVLENLRGIRRQRNRYMGKILNRWLNIWSFYQLQTFIKYKAEFEGKEVVFVNPYMTSQICSKCGQRGSRYYDSFYCSYCGFTAQSDFNASCNLRRLIVSQPNISNDNAKTSIDGLRLSSGII
jgi:IS605 OrfB family transposase